MDGSSCHTACIHLGYAQDSDCMRYAPNFFPDQSPPTLLNLACPYRWITIYLSFSPPPTKPGQCTWALSPQHEHVWTSHCNTCVASARGRQHRRHITASLFIKGPFVPLVVTVDVVMDGCLRLVVPSIDHRCRRADHRFIFANSPFR